MLLLLRIALYLLRPLRWSSRRWRLVERLLGLDFAPRELESVRAACAGAGQPLGAYYYWKLAQVAEVAIFRRLDKDATLALIARSDETDYSALDLLLRDPRGALLAIPHHGSFVFSIVALAERIRRQRQVFVFYETPKVHATNEVFDVLYTRLFADPSSGVTILHNNRNGLATAIKQLKLGSLVVIMPDVYKDRDDTYQVPFCGRSRNAMLGTAVLARRTASTILPMVSDPSGKGFGFKTRFADPIERRAAAGSREDESAATALYEDYRTTAALFGRFERFMRDRLLHWQYCRTHHFSEPAPPRLDAEALARLSELFLKDPRVHVDLASPMAIAAE
jgi:hypothetical protein